jgi:hypothetical protein
MKSFVSKLIGSLDQYLGRCPKCATTAFNAAVIALLLAFVVEIMNMPLLAQDAIRILAAGFAALWLAHLGAYAVRTSRSSTASNDPARRESSGSHPPAGDRRQFVFAFAKSFLFAITVTAVPFRSVFAADCPCSGALPKCCYDYNGQNPVCAPSDAVCCAGSNPWYCQSGHNCLGTSQCT